MSLEISKSIIDIICITGLMPIILFAIDWGILSLYHENFLYGDYVEYRHIPFPIAWFIGSLVFGACAILWLSLTHSNDISLWIQNAIIFV